VHQSQDQHAPSQSCACGYLVAVQGPVPRDVLAHGKAERWFHLRPERGSVETVLCCRSNPAAGDDLSFASKRGTNVQAVCGPTGFHVAIADVEASSVREIFAARFTQVLEALHGAAALFGVLILTDKGYDGAVADTHIPTEDSDLHHPTPPATR